MREDRKLRRDEGQFLPCEFPGCKYEAVFESPGWWCRVHYALWWVDGDHPLEKRFEAESDRIRSLIETLNGQLIYDEGH